MRYIMWGIKLIIFAVIVVFAYKNMQPVEVRFFGQSAIAGIPLVVVMLISFVIGTLLGVFLMLPSTWRRRREASRLRRDLSHANKRQVSVGGASSDALSDKANAPL